MLRSWIFVLLLSLWVGCDSGTDIDRFQVTLSDTDGIAVLTGELSLNIEQSAASDDPGEVTGRWRLEGVGSVPDPTPASGVVIGSTSAGQVDLTLDLDASDSGFNLFGSYDGNRMEGTWSSITIAGPVPGGAFLAIRE